jgi:hypothetical protein
MVRSRIRPVLFGVTALLGGSFLVGCGGERMETGTQVQVSDAMLKEAAAADAFMDQEAAAKKAGRKGANAKAADAAPATEPNP